MMRSHYCGQLNESLDGQEITLCGWVHRRRDHGGVIFLDIRDREGLAQVVFDPDRAETFAVADRVRSEFVVCIRGKVRLRPAGAVNPNIASGAIEVLGYELDVLNEAETPPFPLNEYSDVGEETRLRYRFIDLRRPEMAEKLKLRSRITASIRRYLDENGFLDVETPILGRPTPEGARDYLVPSRTHAGNFFALPQSPQLFKQLLMVAGFDRYYQIAKCFRDEDLRADRQPEFTQIDIETSFLEEADIIAITEGMIRKLFKEVLDLEFGEFPHMPFEEAMRRYGSDKPDLRIPLELVDVADQLNAVEFKVFSGPANDPKGRVAALRVPGAASMPRSQIDDYTKFVGIYGAKGLAYIKVNERAKGVEGLQSPIVKFIPEDNLNVILDRVGAQDGDIVFFGADKAKIVSEALGALRIKLGHDLKLLTCEWAPLWVVDFPMFEENDDGSRVGAAPSVHCAQVHPRRSWRPIRGAALSRAYDMVLNGTELGGGSDPYSPQGNAAGGIPHPRHRRGRAGREVRLPPRRAEVRRAAAWRSGLRPGPAGDADDRCAVYPRSDRVPENPERCGRDDPSAGCGGQQGAARPAHPPARAAQGGISTIGSLVLPGFFVLAVAVCQAIRRSPPAGWVSELLIQLKKWSELWLVIPNGPTSSTARSVRTPSGARSSPS